MSGGAAQRVWVDDGDAIFRRGVASWLREYGFAVAGESAGLVPPPGLDGRDILLFDVATIDVALVLERPPGVRLVAVASSADHGDELLEAGEGRLAGVVLREGLTPEALAGSLLAVAGGYCAFPRAAMTTLASNARAARQRVTGDLKGREIKVLRMLADGASTVDIATELAYSERTVKNVVHDLLAKLGCHTRAHAVACAARHGLLY